MKAALLLVLMTVLVGCTTTVIPPQTNRPTTQVYLADYGRHSSLLLPEDSGGYSEYAFGDWEWFAVGDTLLWVGIGSMLHSSQATLGRRNVEWQPDVKDFAHALGAEKVQRIACPVDRVAALAGALDQRYWRDAAHGGDDEIFYSDYSELWHVKDNENYCALHNCNHVTARWLRELGCTIRGPAMFSAFQVKAK